MKRFSACLVITAFTFITILINTTTTFADSIVYDNTITPTYGVVFGSGSSTELGDEITLGGTDRIITDFIFYYNTFNVGDGLTAKIRFYKNDGQLGIPNTLLYDSGSFTLPVSDGIYTLNDIFVEVPDSFTWTFSWETEPFECIGWCMITPSFVSLLTYDPPVVGFSDNYYWSLDYYTSSWIKEEGASNFGVKIMATSIPEPSTLLLLGSGLIGLAGLRKRFKT